MINKIEHIGIAVKDLEKSEEIFEKILGKPPYKKEIVDSEGITTSFFMLGKQKIELLKANNLHSPIYKFIAKRLIAFIEESEFLLVERMAEEVAAIVLNEFSVPWLKLRVSKPGALRGSKDVGIILQRGKKPAGVAV